MTRLARREDGRLGAHHDIVDMHDSAYGAHTFSTPARAGCRLPSDAFCGSTCITRGEWERRHAAAYQAHEEAPAAAHNSAGAMTGRNPVCPP